MRIAMVQCNPTVGDIVGNATMLLNGYHRALVQGAELVITGELALTGYPPDDLLLRPAFVEAVDDALRDLAEHVGDVPFVVGAPVLTTPSRALDVEARVSEAQGVDVPADGLLSDAASLQSSAGRKETPRLGNAAVVLRDRAVERTYRKRRIPNYGVFDEARYFLAVDEPVVIQVGDTGVGLTVCEDLWGAGGPVAAAASQGARVVVNINASPYHVGKRAEREAWARSHARQEGVWLIYVNLVGGQDEVVFDGDSFAMDPSGTVTTRAAQFLPDLVMVDTAQHADRDIPQSPATTALASLLDPVAEVYDALVLATRDYLHKNGFDRALIGVSGGLDSAVTTAVAVDAIGPGNVTGVAMPSPYSSAGSLTDARALIDALGATYLELPIEPAMRAFDTILAEPFAGTEPGITEENIQSRTRGLLWMALSNKRGELVLTTGNKSEYAVGYATLYGDMCGGFAPLKDVYKTMVFAIARYRNIHHRRWWHGPANAVIPESTIAKPPSAELRPGQVDTESLPPYEALDGILQAYIERSVSVREIINAGNDPETVARVARLVDLAEYKRRQAAPGVKVTRKAFGRDRRLPITNAWRSIAS